MSVQGLSPGDKVSYQRSIFGNWRDAVVVEIDTTELLPLIIEDCETEQRLATDYTDIV